jgi:ABC-type transport system involved in cytochrome bd biosynthesis fused ATPase/permease subunit
MKSNHVKTAFTSLLMLVTLFVNPSPANAQKDNLQADQQQQENQYIAQSNELNSQKNQFETQYKNQYSQHKQHGDQQKNVEAQRIAFITQQLNLTPDEAKVFWPVYNEYDAKRRELKKSLKQSGDYHKKDLDKLTEKEANQILDNQIIEAQKLLDLRKEYHARFKSVLPAVKVLKLYDAEREFQKMLMEKMRQYNKQSPPPGKK